MNQGQIEPHRITQPFQLMAAWFLTLVIMEGIFVTAAVQVPNPNWIPAMFSVAAVALAILVFIAVFLMQTVFRPHLQEAPYYSEWLKDERRYSEVRTTIQAVPISSTTDEAVFTELRNVSEAVLNVQRLQQKSTEILSRHLPLSNDTPELASVRELNEELSKKLSDEAESIAAIHKDYSYPVQVVEVSGARGLITALRENGLFASLYEEPGHKAQENSAKRNQAIWLGHNVPLPVAVKALTVGHEHWPHLRYVHLSSEDDPAPDYVHCEIFIGGSTDTARKYGCREWTAEDFTQLATFKSLDELHSFVRSKHD